MYSIPVCVRTQDLLVATLSILLLSECITGAVQLIGPGDPAVKRVMYETLPEGVYGLFEDGEGSCDEQATRIELQG